MAPFIIPEPSPTNLQLLALSAAQLLSGPMEAFGLVQAGYSKFANSSSSSKQPMIPSKYGMIMIYMHGLAAGILRTASAVMGITGAYTAHSLMSDRTLLTAVLMMIHFGKRMLEVLFLHRYSGKASAAECLIIGFFYGVVSYLVPWWTSQAPQSAYDALPFATTAPYVGVVVFAIGSVGNLYHHYLLTCLRKGDSKQYKVPTGGLFGLVTCPHYMFELVAWYGVAIASQHLGPLLVALAMTSYLSGRAVATRKWYISKLEDFPKTRKAILPFIF